MPNSMGSRTLTIRLKPEVYSAAQEVARQRRVSLNTLMQSSLIDTLRAADEQARYDDYTLLGKDQDACDVEYAIHAQAEVMLGDDHE